VAFVRGSDVVTAVTRHSALLAETGWGETQLMLPGGTWQDRISGRRFSANVSPAALFADLPVVLLERTDD
jgi:(1->4)-alpha-D-glucan 1-alpha-D-glucosylmutase